MIDNNAMSFDEFMNSVFFGGQVTADNKSADDDNAFDQVVSDTIDAIDSAKRKAQLRQLGNIIEDLTVIAGIYATLLADQEDGQL